MGGAQGKDGSGPLGSGQRGEAPTHAGGVVVRRGPDGREYLLVRAKRDPGQWVLPKGHIEPGESPERTALREVREEAGVAAAVRRPLGEVAYSLEGRPHRVAYYLMAYTGEAASSEKRELVWLSPSDAQERLSFPNLRELLDEAERASG